MWEGVIQPILTIKVNASKPEAWNASYQEGSLLRQGDTILVMENPDLLRSIEDQRDDWEKQLITYREKEIEMEQKSLNLQQQALQTDYDSTACARVLPLTRGVLHGHQEQGAARSFRGRIQL